MIKILKNHIFTNNNLFEAVYLVLAVAMFEHTAWAGAAMFVGVPDTPLFSISDPQWVRGALIAVAIDVGLYATARALIDTSLGLSKVGKLGMGLTFALLAFSSAYVQLVYAAYHVSELEFSAGLSGYWRETLGPVLEAGPVVLSLMLPVFVTFYTISRITVTRSEERVKEEKSRSKKYYSDLTGKWYKTQRGLKTAETMYQKSH